MMLSKDITTRLDLAVLTNFIPPTRAAMFRCIAGQLRTRFFVDTTMEANREWEADTADLDIHRVRGLSIPIRYRHSSGFRDRSYLHLSFGILPSLLAARPRAILSGELGLRTGLACLCKKLFPSTRLTVWVEGTPHTDNPRGTLRRMWRKFIAPCPDCFIAVSTGAADLLRTYSVPDERIKTIYFVSGFNPPPPAMVPQRNESQRLRLLHCGQLSARKNVKGFLRALIEVARDMNRPVEMWFVGSGPEQADLAAMQLPPNLTLKFLGFVPFHRMPEIYSQCGILAFPTLADVWGLVTNEAMMWGIPVLGSRFAQSVCDLVVHGANGWQFTPDDHEDTKQAIRAALTASAENLEQMGRAARETAQDLTPEWFASQVLGILTTER
jgi:glycosyltransferase involved in cell wall biosynthesis